MDTRRCRSPVDMAAVQDILCRLSIHEEDLVWEAHDWSDKNTAGYDAPHPYDIGKPSLADYMRISFS